MGWLTGGFGVPPYLCRSNSVSLLAMNGDDACWRSYWTRESQPSYSIQQLWEKTGDDAGDLQTRIKSEQTRRETREGGGYRDEIYD